MCTIKNLIIVLIVTLSLSHYSTIEIVSSTFVHELIKAKNEQ